MNAYLVSLVDQAAAFLTEDELPALEEALVTGNSDPADVLLGFGLVLDAESKVARVEYL